jgi:hypothetical protein
METEPETLPQPFEALYRIQRALAGHVSFLAACDTNVVFSEYLLYEPILRILATQQYDVNCEVSCADFLKGSGKGDHKRIDFVAVKNEVRFALEVKWPREEAQTLKIEADHEKLVAFYNNDREANSFLCVFGRHDHIKNIQLIPNDFVEPESLPPIYALFRRTQFGCRIFQLKLSIQY